MGLGGFLGKLFGGDKGRDFAELARRLGLSEAELRGVRVAYAEFTIPKKSGGARKIAAPVPELKALQRRILRRLLARLRSHWSCTGFERGHSIVTNAIPHARRAVVVRMDVKDFFPSTSARRINAYFRRIGWGREAADWLTKVCAHNNGLPQGAPTSPRLANLVNYGLDTRLSALATSQGGVYTRYADDLTFSFDEDDRNAVHKVVRLAKKTLEDCGYRLHQGKKLRIRRRHQRQMVTGLVVNGGVGLPRAIRRRLRAVERHLAQGRPATLTPEQMAGWSAFRDMVSAQTQT